MASPSMLHQGIVQLFANSPSLVVTLLRRLGVELPTFTTIADASGDLGELQPVERRADGVVKLLDGERVCFGAIVEIDLSFREAKLFSLPAYLANLRARYRCPVCVVVVTPSRRVAARYRKPIELGPGARMQVLVIGPESIPQIRDAVEAKQNPELAVLSAMAHGRGPADVALEIAKAATDACGGLEEVHRLLYSDLIVKQLGASARREFEELMALGNYEYQTDFVKKIVADKEKARDEGREEGREEGMRAVLTALLRDKFAASNAALAPLADASVEQLEQWTGRVLRAQSLDEVFVE